MSTPVTAPIRPVPRWWRAVRDAVDPLLWWIAEPRKIRVTLFVIYLLLAQSGIQALINPPSSIEGEFGKWGTAVWAASTAIGGVVGASNVLQGWNYIERLGAYASLLGAGMYAVIVFVLHHTTPGQRLSQWGFIAITVVVLIYHLTDPEFRRYKIQPRTPRT